MEWLNLVALAFGPFFGIGAYGLIEERKRAYHRRLDIFKTLMASRGATVSPAHVEALNRIELEFTGDKYQAIREQWALYLDHLNSGPNPPDPLPSNADEAAQRAHERAWSTFETNLKTWSDRTGDRLTALLSTMADTFGYKNLDELRIRKGVYRPKGHTDIENAQQRLLNAAAATFEGRRSLSMWVANFPGQTDEQKQLLELLLRAIDKDGAYRVRIVEDKTQQTG